MELQKSLFARRIKIQGSKKIKNTKNKGFSQGATLWKNKKEGANQK
jgi:hypothetical protein